MMAVRAPRTPVRSDQTPSAGPTRRALAALAAAVAIGAPAAAATPPFGSTADTVFDIVTTGDPSAFVCLSYDGRAVRQMWDKRRDNEFDLEVFLFRAYFSDGPAIDIIVNPEFASPAAAEAEARRYTRPLGQLPPVLRQGIRQVGIHDGSPTYSAGPGKIFVYAGRTTQRIAEGHLEESLLHEAVHASLDAAHAAAPGWLEAQRRDAGFVTRYAERHPEREDLAETALFAYALLRHPDRLPPADSADVRAAVPARLEYLQRVLSEPVARAPVPTPPEHCR
ncbi:MAG: hypothetical protein AB7S99_08575 [Pseudodonghicola sp.]